MIDTGSSASGRILDFNQRLAWLRLIRSENVGPATFRELLNHFGSAAKAIEALPELSARGGKAGNISIASLESVQKECEQAARMGAQFVAMGEPGYPPLLRHIDAPPPLLCVKGPIDSLTEPACGIVGGRNASLAGRKFANLIATDIGNAGFIIVSGLARGIDAAAHNGALSTRTIAVFAGGIDYLYPPEHTDLAQEIIDNGGALVTEMPVGWRPHARDFPRRNRLISGMSYATIVIEAAKRSGSLHTARFASEQGRLVFAAPASPLDPRAEGCNMLIRDGATLVRNSHDVLTDLQPLLAFPPQPPIEIEEPGEDHEPITDADQSDRQIVLNALSSAPVGLDELIRDCKISSQVMQLILLELELAGRLERHAGNKVSLV